MEMTLNYSGVFCELGYDELEVVNGGASPVIPVLKMLLAYIEMKYPGGIWPTPLSWADFKRMEQTGSFNY
ncbi:hypothetical protein [Clostridium grantii]|uniref:Uncharacterized protein n=1 Tax=Clostridium grantii DSM 8605 TaxID=1121316 RepID=A0A1M5Y7I6_9CLOT|nr:hypothetical protein [Clostridium grantii]SHI07936.1 hypothetical protein SAMN02745207_04258 [Clostridium grantii DSM 8605]